MNSSETIPLRNESDGFSPVGITKPTIKFKPKKSEENTR